MAGGIFTFPVAEISIVLIFPILIRMKRLLAKKGFILYIGTVEKSASKQTRSTKHSFLRLKNVLPVPAEAPYAPTYLTYLSLRKVSQ